MNDAMTWALRTAVGGGALLLVGWWLASRQRVPARRQRLGEAALAAALLVPVLALLPGWLPLPVGAPASPRPAEAEVATLPPAEAGEVIVAEEWPLEEEAAGPGPAAPPPETPSPPPADWPWAAVALAAYAAVSAALLGRWLLASFLVHRILRGARPAPPQLRALFAALTGGGRWRLLVSDRTSVPFSVGLWRPAVVLPARLVGSATSEEVEWALRHEVTHLRRQDTRTCWLVALAQVVFFYLPWFWWLRRQVRLAQEMVADAEAAPEGLAADYAQFLLSWAIRPPVGATGVSGAGSDLYRRIAMLLQDREAGLGRCPRRWLLGMGGGLVALAVLAAGARVQARAAAEEAARKADEPKKVEEKKADEPKKKPKETKIAPGLEGLKDVEKALREAGFDDEALKELRQRMDEMRKKMDELRKQFPKGQGLGGGGGAWVFPDLGPGLARSPQQMRLGVQLAKPSNTLIEQLDLPKDQGMVLQEVGPNSAAAKAGMKKHDILLELGGKPVPNTAAGLTKLLQGIKADTPVDAVVLRKGKKETLKGLKLPEAKAQAVPALPGLPMVPGLPKLPVLPRLNLKGLPNVAGASISLSRNNDQFTTTQRKDGVTITLKGKVAQGKAEVSEITIDDGKGKAKTYDSLDKVPAEHQAEAKKLAEMSGTGRMRMRQP